MAIYGNAIMTGAGQGSGGEILPTDAILRVQAPAGSTVTITKGSTTKSDMGHENADDTTVYDYYFIIHQSQFDSVTPWAVTATLSGQTATATIIIDTPDEYDITMSYRIWLIRNGVIQTANFTSVGMKRTSSATLAAVAPVVSYESGYIQIGDASGSNGAGIAYLPQMNISNRSTLHVDGSALNGTSNLSNTQVNAWSAIGATQDVNRIFETQLLNAANTSYESFSVDVDISAVTGSVYFGFNTARVSATAYGSIRVVNLYID